MPSPCCCVLHQRNRARIPFGVEVADVDRNSPGFTAVQKLKQTFGHSNLRLFASGRQMNDDQVNLTERGVDDRVQRLLLVVGHGRRRKRNVTPRQNWVARHHTRPLRDRPLLMAHRSQWYESIVAAQIGRELLCLRATAHDTSLAHFLESNDTWPHPPKRVGK